MKGSKRKRPSGAWELRVYAGRDPVTKKERTLTRTFHGGARAADAALRDFIDEISEEKPGTGKATVRTLLARWVKHLERLDRSPTTLKEYRRIIAKTINPALGAVKLRDLRASHLDDLYSQLSGRGLSNRSVRQVHSVLRAALGQAVKWDYLATNPAVKATPPPERKVEPTPPKPEEVRRMIAAAAEDDPELAALIALAAVTGARRGELCGLRWGDVDWDGHVLSIQRSFWVQSRGTVIVKDTKTHANRRVALDEVGMAILARHRVRAGELAGDLGVEIGPDTPLISYDMSRPIAPDTASHYVRALADRLGIDTHLHALRHFHVTQAIAGGLDVVTVGKRVGHADPSVTLGIYAHQIQERDREAAALIGRLLDPSQNPGISEGSEALEQG